MGRYKEAPWGFECPYKDACPYLGMSTTWASLLISDAQRDQYRNAHACKEYELEVKALEEENRRLAARVQELEARLKQKHRSRFKPSKKKEEASDPAKKDDKPGPKKRGAPCGHPPWARPKPNHIDRVVDVPAPEACPHCHNKNLHATGNTTSQLQEDIVLQPQTIVTEYIHHLSFCPDCRREVFQTGEGELRNCEIGPITKAVAVYLRHEVKLSYRDIRKIFTGLFGMPFVSASAMAFSHRVAKHGINLYEDLRDKIRAAQIIHGDETHWRIDGQNAYLWYAGNSEVAFFHIDHSRSADVAVSIFGDDYQGHLVADSYAAYNAIHPNSRQACLSHLNTTAKEISDRIKLMPQKNQDRKALRFCRSLIRLFSFCCKLDHQRNKGTLSVSDAKAYIPRLERTLATICLHKLEDKDAENLRQRVTDPKRDASKLFTFLEVPGMPPTNNHAEQSLRKPVIFRKICFGNRSMQGAQSFATNLSLLTTASRHNKCPIKLFTNILLKQGNITLDQIYDDAVFDTS